MDECSDIVTSNYGRYKAWSEVSNADITHRFMIPVMSGASVLNLHFDKTFGWFTYPEWNKKALIEIIVRLIVSYIPTLSSKTRL